MLTNNNHIFADCEKWILSDCFFINSNHYDVNGDLITPETVDVGTIMVDHHCCETKYVIITKIDRDYYGYKLTESQYREKILLPEIRDKKINSLIC